MHLISLRNKIILLAIIIMVLSPSLHASAFNEISGPSKISTFSSTANTNPILTVQRRINNTIVEVNQSIIVEIILANIGDKPVYNINLTEQIINNPEIITKNLVTPMIFARFEANEFRIITYTITSLKPANITLSRTTVTFQLANDPSSPIFTSFSTTNFIIVKEKSISFNEENLKYLLLFSVMAVSYSIILIVRTIFKFRSQNRNAN